MSYPKYLDENIIRPVAGFVLLTTLTTLIRPDFAFLLYFLAVDFILRYFHPRLSILTWSAIFISRFLLKQETHPTLAPPKRFAVLVGAIFSTLASLALFIALPVVVMLLQIALIVASGLQSLFGFCVGCTIYDYFLKLGIVGRRVHVNKFLSN